MKPRLHAAALVLFLCASIVSAAPKEKAAGEKPAADLPEPVKKCVEEHLPQSTVQQFEEQTEQGRHIFFVNVSTSDGKAVGMLASGRGQYLGQLLDEKDADPDDVEIDLDSAPATLKAGIKKYFGDTEIDDLSMEVEASRFVYIAEQTDDKDVTQWVTFALGGEVLSIEHEIALKDLPAAVKQGIATTRPSAQITSADLVEDKEKNGKEYVVDVTDGTQKLEITSTIDGKIKSTEPAEDDTPAKN